VSKFIDEATIFVRSGKGGAGCVAFRREKYVDQGGPNGGNGGRGGDVLIVADAQRSTLLDYKFKPRHLAGNGAPGEGNQKTGRHGSEARLFVPVGTVVYDDDNDTVLADLDHAEAQIVVAKGGRGGKGNAHFKSSVKQTPRYAQPGEPWEERTIRLELKLMADVGLVGMPSVGKSSLIAKISAAKAKVAAYPFTTLVPNLGVVKFGIAEHFVVADVPGLIVDAHQGAGLGTQFLRHVERVSRICHLVTVAIEEEGRDPIQDFEAIEREMSLHNEALASVEKVLVLNRIDIPDVAEWESRLRDYANERDIPFFAISAATGAGLEALINHLGESVVRSRSESQPDESSAQVVDEG